MDNSIIPMPPAVRRNHSVNRTGGKTNQHLNPKALTLQSVASFPGLGCWVRLRMLSGAVSRPETTIATTRSWAQASRMRYIFLHTVQGSGFTIVCKLEAILRSAGTVFSSSTTSMQALVTDCFLGSCLLSKTTQARRWIRWNKTGCQRPTQRHRHRSGFLCPNPCSTSATTLVTTQSFLRCSASAACNQSGPVSAANGDVPLQRVLPYSPKPAASPPSLSGPNGPQTSTTCISYRGVAGTGRRPATCPIHG